MSATPDDSGRDPCRNPVGGRNGRIGVRILAAWLSGLAIVLAGIAGFPDSARAVAGEEFTIGQWSGFANFDDNGALQSCIIEIDRPADRELLFSFGRSGLRILILNMNWRLPVGERHPVQLRVDNRWSRNLTATVVTEVSSMIPLGDDREALDALRRGRYLTVEVPQRTFRFSLAGSSAAFAEMLACFQRNSRPAAVAEAPRPGTGPTETGAGSSTNPFAPAERTAPEQPRPAPVNPFAPSGQVEQQQPRPEPANPFERAPSDTGDPSQSAAVVPPPPTGRPATEETALRPRPAVDGLQRIVPYLPFDSFSLIVDLFLPGNPEAVRTPDHILSNYQVEGRTGDGWYRGYYLEAALRGATPEELLDYLMWIEEVACGGPSRSADRHVEHFGDTTVARETIRCDGSPDGLTRSQIVSGGDGVAQIFIIDGEAPALDATAAMYRAFRGLARDG